MNSLLETHAEVAAVLAGFAGVAAVLRRPLSPVEHQRFLSLLFSALIQVVVCLVPVWLSIINVTGAALWRSAALIALVLTLAAIMVLILIPMRTLGASNFTIINAPVNYAILAMSVVVLGSLVVNIIGVPIAPGFALYYLACLLGLIINFFVFADLIVRGEDQAK